jgi:NRAMP (natural resistance-associated macrophage protein)-like metal ion transporter
LGPGIIAANAGNDAGGIATYSASGAGYEYNLLWALALSGISLAIVLEMGARMGAVTGKGLADLIREQFGVRWTALAMVVLLIANTGLTVSEFLGVLAGVQVLARDPHTPLVYLVVPLSGLLLWLLVFRGSYRRVEQVFLIMSLGFLAYIPAAFAAHPSWSDVGQRLLLPQLPPHNQLGDYFTDAVALVGTTVGPYLLFYVQSSVADKGISAHEYRYERIEILSGTFFAMLIAGFVVITTGAALAPRTISTALDAALALQAFVGQYASLLFGLGLLGASLLAAAVVPLSTAYGICEAFGFERSLSRRFREAPVFQSIFSGLLLFGVLMAIFAFVANLPLIQVLLVLQTVNAAMLPILLVFMILLINNRRLMGRFANSRLLNSLAWTTTVVIVILVLVLLLHSFFGITP